MSELDIGLNSQINEFKKKFNIIESKIEIVFEQFSNYIIISKELQQEFEDINKISTGDSRGIDGIGIIVNNRFIADESDLEKIGEDEKLSIKLIFIQATTQKKFDRQKFSSFSDNVISFLLGNLRIEPFSDIYDKLFSEEGDFIDNFRDTPKVVLYFTSAKTKHNIDENYLKEQKLKFINRNEISTKINLEDIYLLQKDELKKYYKNIIKYHTIYIKLFKNTLLEEKEKIKISLLGAIKFKDLKKLILTKDGNLKENLFIENPRSFLKDTYVNNSIKNTLKNENYKPYFLYLNNGLTILCESISRHPMKENVFKLTYPRIINGCQTTNILFQEFQNNNNLDDIEIVVKAIATNDDDLKKQIIFAANNQNSITEDLKSLNEYHKKIEEFFQGFSGRIRLYYERLRGQYSTITPPYQKINIENLAKIYISIFLQEPHKMKSNAIKKIDEYQQDKKIFSSSDDPRRYYFCALLYYWFNKFLSNKVIELQSKTMDMHLLLTCNLLLDKQNTTKYSKNSLDNKITYLQEENNAKKLFQIALNFIKKEKYLFEKRGFYSGPKTKKLINSIKESKLNVK